MKVAKPKADKEKESLLFTLDESELSALERADLEREKALDEFFGDEDSIEYRIYRLQPKGEGVEGFLDVHAAPFTFQDLKSLYGGGLYRIVKQKAGGGKGAFLGQKIERIAGQPKLQTQDSQDKISPREDLRAEIRELKEEITKSKGNSVFTKEFVAELVTAKLLLGKDGGNAGVSPELMRILAESGDKKFEGLLEGIELGKRLEGGGSTEEGEGSWLKPIAEMVARILQGKNLELNTVRRTVEGADAAQIKVTPQPQIEDSEQMLFQKLLLEKLETFILDGIEQNTPVAEMVNQLKPYAAYPSFKSILGAITAEEILLYLKAEYSEDAGVMQHLEKPETQNYLTQILEELKK